MTRDEILNMPAGREMDALIAEKVMGKRVFCANEELGGIVSGSIVRQGVWQMCEDGAMYDDRTVYAESIPHYSEGIAAAWEVVEKMQTIDAERPTEILRLPSVDNKWRVRFTTQIFPGWGDTAPLAICRAALLAAMEAE